MCDAGPGEAKTLPDPGIAGNVVGASHPTIAGPVRLELSLFGRAVKSDGRTATARDRLHHLVKVAGADLALVAGRGVAVRLGRELGLLQLRVGCHPALAIAARQLEHSIVERVEPREGYELELVPHDSELSLERCNRVGVQL